jgi:hypothetical protein
MCFVLEHLPIKSVGLSIDGSVSFFVLYHYETNAILVKPIANIDDRSIFAAYKEIFETLEAKGYKPT